MAAIISALAPRADAVEDEAASPFTVAVYLDNDGGLIKRNNPTDRHYTNGTALTIGHQPDWAAHVAALLPWSRDDDESAAGYIVGQLMFTPDKIEARPLIRDDRPYAGYLFGGAYVQRIDDNRRQMDHVQVEIGIVGPASQAEDAQKAIHELFDSPDPRGWDNQLGDEVTFQLYYRHKWRLGPGRHEGGAAWSWDLIPQAGLALGTVHRHLEAGATVRGGWNLPDDFGPGRIADPRTVTSRAACGFSFYLFGRVGGRVVEHNLFLDGSTFRDSHFKSKEPLVGEGQFGAVLQYHANGCTFEVGYAQTFLTHEFESQQASDSYGTLTVSATLLF